MNALVMYDHQSGPLWRQFLSRGVKGEYAGKQLERVHSVVAFWFAWSDFYPEMELYKAA